jgi:hypothetical protein
MWESSDPEHPNLEKYRLRVGVSDTSSFLDSLLEKPRRNSKR